MRCSLEKTAEILERVLAREIKVTRAARELDLGRKQVRRLLNRYLDDGADGLKSHRKGRPGTGYKPEFRQTVIEIVRTRYVDFGPTLASEKLEERHDIKVSREWLRKAMIEAGIWYDRTARQPKLHQIREPRECRGELVQIDGSHHKWFENRGPKCVLLVFIDDSTSEFGHLEFAPSENALSYMHATEQYIRKHGKPVAFYSDKHSIFRNAKANLSRTDGLTQYGAVLKRLNIGMICADSSQAKGRVERANRTLQDRLVKELRLEGISTIEQANQFLERYRAKHNSKFARVPFSSVDAHRPIEPDDDLGEQIRWEEQRRLTRMLSLHYNKVMFIVEDSPATRKLAGQYVTVREYPDGRVEIYHEDTSLPYRTFDKLRRIRQPDIVDSKRISEALEFAKMLQDVMPHHRKRNAAGPSRRSQSSHMFPDFELSPKGARLENDRTVSRQLSLQYKNMRYVLEETARSRSLIGQSVTIHTSPDGTVEIRHDGDPLPHRVMRPSRRGKQAPYQPARNSAENRRENRQ